jgi:hypothetical protein
MKTNYWTLTPDGYMHKEGFKLVLSKETNLLKIGGTWTLSYNTEQIATNTYSSHLCEKRVLDWANNEITSYKRFKQQINKK